MIYLQLFWEFFRIGLFAVGGGMATLPFLEQLSVRTGWYGPALITDMIAISESTPGPIGINMATYVGCSVAGMAGSVAATLGEICPAILIVTLVSRSLEKFRDSHWLDDAFHTLRPAVTGLIAAAGLGVMEKCMLDLAAYQSSGAFLSLFDWKKLVFFLLAFLGMKKFKWHPVAYIAIAAVVGMIFKF